MEEGEQFSIAQIISITKVRPSRGHATVTSKTRDCEKLKKMESRQYTAYISSITTRLVRVGRRKMSQTSEKKRIAVSHKSKEYRQFRESEKERHTLTHRFLPRKRCETTTEKQKVRQRLHSLCYIHVQLFLRRCELGHQT